MERMPCIEVKIASTGQPANPASRGREECPMLNRYDGQGWKQTTHANPSRVQKRKHQINWLLGSSMWQATASSSGLGTLFATTSALICINYH